jgi:hypothetical protein
MFPASLARRFAALPLSTRILLIVAMLTGLGERIGWGLARRTPYALGEAANVAIAIAQGRGFSDAFMVGQGPTAHLLPIAPAIAGAVYALFGVRTTAAELVLLGWSMAVSFAAYGFFAGAASRLGFRRSAVIGGFIFLMIAPIYTTNEAFEWRVWEGGLGLGLGSALLWLLLRADSGERVRGFAFWRAALPALAFFVNPPVGLAAFAAWALFSWRHRRTDGLVRPMAAALLALALLVGPWTLRNQLVMGHPITLRDDLGMELAMANFPGAVNPADPDTMLLDRLKAIQPYIHPIPYAALQGAGGEVAYSKLLGRETINWIRAHPGDFATISLRHLREMILPPYWFFQTSHGHYIPIFRGIASKIVNILGLIGLAMGLWRRDWRYLYIAPYVLLPILLYIPFQPVIRYAWLVYPPLAYLAADALSRVPWRRRFSASAMSPE